MAYLLSKWRKEFDLIISFCGSTSCSPELQRIFDKHLDERFMFPSYNAKFLDTLCKQQEDLKREGRIRRVLILMDDVETDSESESKFAFFSTRHRHYNVSIAMCSVRYSHVPKSYRASADCLFLFSTCMHSDRELLLKEFSANKRFSEYCMMNLEKYTALVFTSGYKQETFKFRIQDDLKLFNEDDDSSEEETQETPIESPPIQNPNPEPEVETEMEEHVLEAGDI